MFIREDVRNKYEDELWRKEQAVISTIIQHLLGKDSSDVDTTELLSKLGIDLVESKNKIEKILKRLELLEDMINSGSIEKDLIPVVTWAVRSGVASEKDLFRIYTMADGIVQDMSAEKYKTSINYAFNLSLKIIEEVDKL